MSNKKKRNLEKRLAKKSDYSQVIKNCDAELKELFVESKASPDKNCKKCYGRGYIGFDYITKQILLCKCFKTAYVKKRYEEKLEMREKKKLEEQKMIEEQTIKDGDFKGYVNA
jgi:hypothetical protein